MKKLRFFALCPAILCSAFMMNAETAYRSVSINRHDGSSMLVRLENDIKASVEGGNLLFSCSKGEVKVAMKDVNHWTYSTNPGPDWTTGIESVGSDTVIVEYSDSELSFHVLTPGTELLLAAIDGRIITQDKAATSDYVINISSLLQGVYVASYGNHSFKFVVR